MNPGKVVDPYPIDENLRLGPTTARRSSRRTSTIPDDDGSFARATLRCVGVGECRREDGGDDVPELHGHPRGDALDARPRAPALRDARTATRADKTAGASEHVKEALDLCLACKGCKGDCPVNVDMATYKAEFLSHYYEGRLRPRARLRDGPHRLLGAARVPLRRGCVNWLATTPGSVAAGQVRWAASRRSARCRAFAPRDLPRRGSCAAAADAAGQPRVMLWPDTFNNHFHPETAHAARRGARGRRLPRGAPAARRSAAAGRSTTSACSTRARAAPRDDPRRAPAARSRAGIAASSASSRAAWRSSATSCASCFPDDEDAKRLARPDRSCSASSSRSTREGAAARAAAGAQGASCRRTATTSRCWASTPRRRCSSGWGSTSRCSTRAAAGWPGAFGFEAEQYDVSHGVGERRCCRRCARPDDETLLVADGFSCREQIEQGRGRRALHLAEVLRSALAHPPPPAPRPRFRIRGARIALLGLSVLAVAGAGILWRSRR